MQEEQRRTHGLALNIPSSPAGASRVFLPDKLTSSHRVCGRMRACCFPTRQEDFVKVLSWRRRATETRCPRRPAPPPSGRSAVGSQAGAPATTPWDGCGPGFSPAGSAPSLRAGRVALQAVFCRCSRRPFLTSVGEFPHQDRRGSDGPEEDSSGLSGQWGPGWGPGWGTGEQGAIVSQWRGACLRRKRHI